MPDRTKTINDLIERIEIKNSGDAFWANLSIIPFLDGQVDDVELEVIQQGLPKYLGQMREVGKNSIIDTIYRPFPGLNASDWPELFNFVSETWDLPEEDEEGNIKLISINLSEGTTPTLLENLFDRVRDSYQECEDIRNQIAVEEGGWVKSSEGRPKMPPGAAEFNKEYLNAFLKTIMSFFEDNYDRRNLLFATTIHSMMADGDHVGMEQIYLKEMWKASGTDADNFESWKEDIGWDRFKNFEIPTLLPLNSDGIDLNLDEMPAFKLLNGIANIINTSTDVTEEDAELETFMNKYVDEFEWNEVEENKRKHIKSFEVLIVKFSPQYKSHLLDYDVYGLDNDAIIDLKQHWDDLFPDSIDDSFFESDEPGAVKLRKTLNEIGPDLLSKLLKNSVFWLVIRQVTKDVESGQVGGIDEDDFVSDLTATDDRESFNVSGGLAFLHLIAEQRGLFKDAPLTDRFVSIMDEYTNLISSQYLRLSVSEFDFQEKFNEFLKTMRRSVRLAHKKHAVSLITRKFQRDFKKLSLPEHPVEEDLINFLENSLVDYRKKSTDLKSKLVLSLGLLAVKSAFQKLGFKAPDGLVTMWDDAKHFADSHSKEMEKYLGEQEAKSFQKKNSYKKSLTSSMDYNENNDSWDAEKIGTWLSFPIAFLLIFGVATCVLAAT